MHHRSIGLAALALALGCSAESTAPGKSAAPTPSDAATPAVTVASAVVKVTGMT